MLAATICSGIGEWILRGLAEVDGGTHDALAWEGRE